MLVWGLPLWFWLLILGLIVVYMYILKVILGTKEENLRWEITTVEERLRWEITKMKCFEIIAWILLAVSVIIDAYGILNLNPIVISVAGCLIVGSYLVATYYRKRRFKHQQEKKLL